MIIHHLPGRAISFKEEEWLYFSGTAYLGIPHHPGFRDLLREGLDRYGTHFGGSRRSTIELAIFEEAEAYLAAYTHTARALLVSSGTMAGQLLLKILRREAELALAPGVHPALWDMESPAVHSSWTDWTIEMEQRCAISGPPLAILCNAMDPLGVRDYDFSFLARLNPNRQLILVVDDSHGFGVLGPHGAGILPTLGHLKNMEVLGISSLGKASGIPAGVILGPTHWIEKIWQSPYFGGASPAAPAYLYAFLHAREIYAEQRERLQKNIHQFVQAIPQPARFRTLPGFPALFSEEENLAAVLASQHILISSFRYPTAQDPVFTRIVLNSQHTAADIDTLIRAIQT